MRALAAALVLLASAGCAAEARGERDPVAITIRHSRFRPTSLTVEAGTTVRFIVRNTDPIDHELIIGDQAVQEQHESGAGHHHGAIPGEISVPAGQTRSTTYTFTEPGTLLFGCHLPGHYDYGMRGEITVIP